MTTQLDLWDWPLDVDDARRAGYAAHLSPDEEMRADRFVSARDRNRFIVARGKMREILAERLGKQPAELLFQYLPHGKPLLRDGPHFNLSHSDGWAALVISSGPAVGIDIEWHRPVEEVLAEMVFSAQEQRDLQRHVGPDRIAAFYRGWTRKEAYLKACGSGLARALDSFDVTLDPGPAARITRIEDASDDPAQWRLLDLDLGRELAGAIAVHTAAPTCLRRHTYRHPRHRNDQTLACPI